MSPGSRGRPRQRLGDRGAMQPPSLSKRRLLPRVQLLPLLLLALALGLALFMVWNGWHPEVQELSRSRDLRVRPAWGPGPSSVSRAERVTSLSPSLKQAHAPASPSWRCRRSA